MNPIVSIHELGDRSRVNEGETAELELRLDAPSAGFVTVRLSPIFRDEEVSFPLSQYVFAPGETSIIVEVVAVDDDEYEAGDNVLIRIDEAIGATISPSNDRQAVVRIAESDIPDEPIILFPNTSRLVEEGEFIDVPVALTKPSDQTVTAEIVLQDQGDAGQFEFVTSTVTFAPGETTGSFRVRAIDDDIYEEADTIYFEFGTVTGATISDESFEDRTGVRIERNDLPELPRVSYDRAAFEPKSTEKLDEGDTVTVFLQLDRPGIQDVTVNLDVWTSEESVDQTDFEVVFAPGQTRASFSFTVVDDLVEEAFESFNLYLRRVDGAIVDDPSDRNVRWVVNGNDAETIGTDLREILIGDETDNRIEGMGGADTLTGLGGRDSLIGGDGDDTLDGGNGNDVLYGQSGDDILDGGAGVDLMDGGTGDDTYYVDDDGDIVVERANSGNDTVILSGGAYTLNANIENVQIAPNAAGVQITGNDDANAIGGSNGDDVLRGLGGNDKLSGLAGADRLIGGDGNDLYTIMDADAVVIEARNGGYDTVRTFVDFTLASDVERGIAAGSREVKIYGNELDNMLIGSGAANVLSAYGGDDLLDGRGGADTMRGGFGADTYIVDDAGDVVFEAAGAGRDTVLATVATTLSANVEIARWDGDGAATLTGGRTDNFIFGTNRSDLLSGGAGDDYLYGEAGGDRLNGDVGDDVLKGDAGADNLFGGLGDDRLLGGDDNDRLRGEDGDDALFGNAGDDDLDGGRGDDFLSGNVGDDRLAGGTGSDVLRGNRGNDTLEGGRGGDRLYGGGNDDTLEGGKGNDFVYGETGSDRLDGGAGDDVLDGGVARDVFVYSSAADGSGGFDRVNDFEVGIDRIDLTAFGFDSYAQVGALTTEAGQGHARLDFGGGDTLYLLNVTAGQLDEDDFIL